MCVCYYDIEERIIRADFLKLISVYNVSGQSLSNHIIDDLKKLNIKIKNFRGPGYDGAISINRKFNGVAVVVKKMYLSALYVHFSDHNLNRSVSWTCNIQGIRNTMGFIEACYNFFNNQKKQKFLFSKYLIKRNENNSLPKKEKLKTMVDVWSTRWIKLDNSIETFYDIFPAIIQCLKEMTTWKDNNTSSKENCLLLTIRAIEFNVFLTVLNHIFQYTH